MPTPVAPAQLPPHRFTIEDYLRMGETGILRTEDRVELIDGQVVSMSPISNWHDAAVERLLQLLFDQIKRPGRLLVRNAVNIWEATQVMPDLAVVSPMESPWERGFVGEDTLLIIEVAQSSLATDRTSKKAVYAAEGVPEYWIVDLEGRSVEVYTHPQDGDYRTKTVHARDAVATSVSMPGVSVAVAEVTPPTRHA